MAGKQKCVEKIWRDWNHTQCSRSGVLEHNGNLYCKQHHPPTVKRRDVARQEKWRAEWDEAAIKNARREAEQEALKGISNPAAVQRVITEAHRVCRGTLDNVMVKRKALEEALAELDREQTHDHKA